MTKHCSYHISLATLILCLCLGSLVILPLVNVSGLSALVVSRVDIENHDLFEQLESLEELFLLASLGVTITKLLSSKFAPVDLDLPIAEFASVSPPPKSS